MTHTKVTLADYLAKHHAIAYVTKYFADKAVRCTIEGAAVDHAESEASGLTVVDVLIGRRRDGTYRGCVSFDAAGHVDCFEYL